MAKLDAKKRNALESGEFALPDRKYPVDTAGRARAALARISQFGSPAEKSKVSAAVRSKFPSMKLDGMSDHDADDK